MLDIGSSERLVLNTNGGDDRFAAGADVDQLIAITVDGGAATDTPGIAATFASIESFPSAVTGTTSAGILSVFGDALDNTITISRDAAGKILVNGGAVAIVGGTATVANTSLIQVFGLGGNDTIALNEANGALPRANLFGGSGNDILTGGSGGDMIFGQSGNDTLLGKGGIDLLFGGADNDVLTGGDGDDQAFGESGNDRVVWNPGDDTDLNEGGDGSDTVEVNGGNAAEIFTVTPNGTRVRFDRVDPAPFSLDIGTSENLVLNANGGDDSFSASNGLATLIQITVDGGAGNDTILGSRGNDTLLGGDGNDFVDGQQGDDVALLGAGDDTFQWDPGDGSDTVEGQDGSDTLLFNGANIAENSNISANGGRVRFTRDVASIVMDINDVERVDFNARGGADTIAVNDLTGTKLAEVNLDLAGVPGSGVGDGQVDNIIVNGTAGPDTIAVGGSSGAVTVSGLASTVKIAASEAADKLTVNSLAGADTVDASGLAAGVIDLTLNGGADADVLIGSPDADVVTGGTGNDVALLGAGDDTFQWNPGDGSDTVEGQDGFDTMLFNGANIAENINISANGGRVRFTRDVASIVMDINDVERVDFNARGGADTIAVNDLTGTAVTEVNLDLAGIPGSGTGDGQLDHIIVNGTNGNDSVEVLGSGTSYAVVGLPALVQVTNSEGANDQLVLNALGGDDTISTSTLVAGIVKLTVDGGAGNDTILGSRGNDTLLGGDGNDFVDGQQGDDVALLGAGDDTFQWNPGDGSDTVEGQDGSDTLLFNGANIAENSNIS